MKTTAAVSLGAIAAQIGARAFAAGSDKIRIGVIGCGGRGMDAVRNCIDASESVELVAIADLFKDHIDLAMKLLPEGVPNDKDKPPCRADSTSSPKCALPDSMRIKSYWLPTLIWSC